MAVLLLLTGACSGASSGGGSTGSDVDTVGCDAGVQSVADLDLPLEVVRPTPEQAVLAVEDGFTVTVVEPRGGGRAGVEAESADGTVVRVFDLRRVAGGWSPTAYVQCADVATGRPD